MYNTKQKSIIDLKDKTLIEVFTRHLLRYGGFKLVGFGVFSLKKAVTSGFNPYTKKRGKSKKYVKVNFTASKNLKEFIQTWKK